MSAYSNLAGLYPPTEGEMFDPSLKWQPIPVHTRPEKEDNVSQRFYAWKVKGNMLVCNYENLTMCKIATAVELWYLKYGYLEYIQYVEVICKSQLLIL